MSLKFFSFFIIIGFLIGACSADIFGDFFQWDLKGGYPEGNDDRTSKRDEEASSAENNCDCEGPKCKCCVDFNISNIIDLGGPGCVLMRYVSESEGISLNVSYGNEVVHSQNVVDEKKQGACMPLLSDFAEFCARFSKLTKFDNKMTGCLNFEPTVLGEVTAQYFVGCFRISPDNMILDNSLRNSTQNEEESQEEQASAAEKPENESQSFLEAVNQSAQESLEFFSGLLGIGRPGGKKKKNSDTQNKPEIPGKTS